MQLYKTTHETDWRRVKWVYDTEHQTRGSYAYDTEAETKAAEDQEIEGLNNGTLVVLGALVEVKCPHCRFWTDKDSLWGIVVTVDEDLEAYGTECLNIPEAPEDMDCADTSPPDLSERAQFHLDVAQSVPAGKQIPLSKRAQDYVEAAALAPLASAVAQGLQAQPFQKRRLPKKVRDCIKHALRRADSKLRTGCGVSEAPPLPKRWRRTTTRPRCSAEAQEAMRLYLDTWVAGPLRTVLAWDDGSDEPFPNWS